MISFSIPHNLSLKCATVGVPLFSHSSTAVFPIPHFPQGDGYVQVDDRPICDQAHVCHQPLPPSLALARLVKDLLDDPRPDPIFCPVP